MQENKLAKIVSLCARRGFTFPSCDIYGGLTSLWDYGPLGVLLKKNIKDSWWKSYVEIRDDIVGLDSAILGSEDVFKASGHLSGFNDVLVECKECKKRFKVEHLEDATTAGAKCPECGNNIDFKDTPPREFNLMLKTSLGVVKDSAQTAYLRPETAQGIFINFSNVLNTLHKKIPFGIAQIGKSFRNEVTTKSFVFRTREFEQMEIEYFSSPKDSQQLYEYWRSERMRWYVEDLGVNKSNLRFREHQKDELAHYAKACVDIEYNFPFGWKELEGIASRGDFDLSQHSKFSKKDLSYLDTKTQEKFLPHVIEPSAGVDRTFLALLSDAYFEEEVNQRKRVVLKFDKRIAPYKIAVFPLLKNNAEIVEMARKIYDDLKLTRQVVYDDTAAIGKLYRRQDEIGTPFCLTVDVDSLTDKKVTVRERDSMTQERVAADNLAAYFQDKFI